MEIIYDNELKYKVSIDDLRDLFLNIHELGPTGPNYIDENNQRIIRMPVTGAENKIIFTLEEEEPKSIYKYIAFHYSDPVEIYKNIPNLTEEQKKSSIEFYYKTFRDQNKKILEDGRIEANKEIGKIHINLEENPKNETLVKYKIEYLEGDKWFFASQDFFKIWIDLAIPKMHSKKIAEMLFDIDSLGTEVKEIKDNVEDIDARVKNVEITSRKFSLLIQEEDKTLKDSVNDLLQSQFENWIFLEENSKIFLTTAELIKMRFGDELEDYCPVVMSYAKAFETECNIKIFDNFRKFMHKKYRNRLQEIIKEDLQKIPQESFKVFSPVCRFLEGKREIELGMMNIFLGLSKGKTSEISQILQEFNTFLSDITNDITFLIGKEDEYLPKRIEKIRIDCRNGSAHTEKIPYEKAQWCISFITESLIELSQNLKI